MAANLPDVAVFLLDGDLRILLADGEAWRSVPWFDETMFRGRRVQDLRGEIPDDVLDAAVENYSAALAGERREFSFTDAGGATFSVVAVPAATEDGGPAAVVVARDVTRQIQAEAELAAAADLHRTLASNIPDTAVGIIGDDLRWEILEGERILAQLGVTREQVIGRMLGEVHGPLAEAALPVIERAFAGSAGAFDWASPDGRTYSIRVAPVGGSGPAGRAVVSAADTTESTRAEANLKETKARFEGAFEHAPIGMTLVNVSDDDFGVIVLANSALCELLGYAAPDLIGRRFTEVTHPEDVDRDLDLVRRLASGEVRSLQREKRYVTANGDVVLARVSAALVPGTGGAPGYGLAHIQDITHERSADEAVANAARIWQAAFSTALDAMLVTDDDRRIVEVNAAAAELLGLPSERLIGRKLADFAERAGTDPSSDLAIASGKSRGGYVVRRPDGELRDVEYSTRAQFVPGRHLSIMRDVTERKRAEDAREQAHAANERLNAALHQSRKLETVGQLAGGVAHDFNNLLAVIINYSDLLLEQIGGTPGADDLREIRLAAERAAALTRQLLAFSRQDAAQQQSVDLNATVSSVARMLRRTIGEHIVLEEALDPDLPIVLADPTHVEQVLINLAVNARDAMPDGGRVTISTGTTTFDAGDAADHHDVTSGRYAHLAVCDTGAGMSDAVRARAFDPFFTTKPKGAGTGLGLATAYGLVKQNGGDIEISSAEGAGSTLHVYLPLASSTPAERTENRDAPSRRGHGQRILVVEDEPGVLDIIERILVADGYQVVTAASPLEALDKGVSDVDLVLSDVVMPQMSGIDLVVRLRDDVPELRAVFMSGYSDVPGGRPEGASFIAKPFTRDDLLQEVARVLDAGG